MIVVYPSKVIQIMKEQVVEKTGMKEIKDRPERAIEARKNVDVAGKPVFENPAVKVENLFFSYGDGWVLDDIDLEIPGNQVTAFIGPSGCGKSTLIRCFNRLNDLIDGTRLEGRIYVKGEDIHDPSIDVT